MSKPCASPRLPQVIDPYRSARIVIGERPRIRRTIVGALRNYARVLSEALRIDRREVVGENGFGGGKQPPAEVRVRRVIKVGA